MGAGGGKGDLLPSSRRLHSEATQSVKLGELVLNELLSNIVQMCIEGGGHCYMGSQRQRMLGYDVLFRGLRDGARKRERQRFPMGVRWRNARAMSTVP